MKGKLYYIDLGVTSKARLISLLRGLSIQGFKAGIYFFINKSDGKMYIGSSINMTKRISGYPRRDVKGNSHINNALLKYGLESFLLLILIVGDCNQEFVLSLEQAAIDCFKPSYNILPKVGSFLGWEVTPEYREKMRQATLARGYKGELHPSYNTGKPVYLLQVLSTGFKLAATFPNISRCSETLGIKRGSMWKFINQKKVFIYNGNSHLLSYDPPQNL